MDIIDIKSCTLCRLEEEMKKINEKKFRATQIFCWIHQKNANNFDEMSNLSKELRENLKKNFFIPKIEIIKKLISKNDKTIKYLFKLEDNHMIESVLMEYSYGLALCISSQAGCKMGCKFCASGIDGLERSLSPSEMLMQIYEIQKDTGKRIRSIVLMGSGEPFDNYDNFLDFLNIINDENGINLGQRHITVSTCGIVPKIYSLAKENLQINLSLSLHAHSDELRQEIMPIANKYSIRETIDACIHYAETTKRRVTYEYALINGVNDKKEYAKALAKLLKGTLCHINLIPINDVKEREYKKSSKENIKKFADILINAKIETTVRRELGSDINASCGQLRKSYKE